MLKWLNDTTTLIFTFGRLLNGLQIANAEATSLCIKMNQVNTLNVINHANINTDSTIPAFTRSLFHCKYQRQLSYHIYVYA